MTTFYNRLFDLKNPVAIVKDLETSPGGQIDASVVVVYATAMLFRRFWALFGDFS